MIEDDVDLAEREIKSIFSRVSRAQVANDVIKSISLPKEIINGNSRKCAPIGFIATENRCSLWELALRLSFVQEIWLEGSSKDNGLAPAQWWIEHSFNNKRYCCILPMMASAELLSYLKGKSIDKSDFERMIATIAKGTDEKSRFLEPLRRRNTSAPHVHGLHRYKAKFFPRMIRSILVSERNQLPEVEEGRIVILDPFVGSGTTLVEASLLGLESIGIDIDPLSVLISKAKLDVLKLESQTKLDAAINKVKIEAGPLYATTRGGEKYRFPSWIERKFERTKSHGQQRKYEDEISAWRSAISDIEEQRVREILEVCLSDAISRKFNIRMMGTGVGRFALEIGNTDLSIIMNSNLDRLKQMASVCSTIKSIYDVHPAPSKVIEDTAISMPLKTESVSMVMTSPPYLPASSGRENYLLGKSISITALNLMSENEIVHAEGRSIGSMKTFGESDLESLPQEVNDAYVWLKSDPLRKIKAEPVASYYSELKKALLETHRVLLPGGLAAYVIGKESIFYEFKSRKTLYRVDCAGIFQQIAFDCDFSLEERIDVQLDKKNANARPRSLDSYYETIFILKKNAP
jgi:hypothetical protein